MKKNKILINTIDGKYPIYIGENLIYRLGSILAKNSVKSSKFLLVIDNKIPKKLIKSIKKSLKNKCLTVYFTSNEKNKSQKSCEKTKNRS